ncbi:MAG: triose-phosphate isomerase, partial [Longimicrobiales bacterium]
MSDDGRALRAPVIAGNWKMHKGPAETREFLRAFSRSFAARQDRTVALFPPSLSLTVAVAELRERADIRLGVQNIHWEAQGAFTGEISAAMAREAGADIALIGHSERRHVFGETDDQVRRKVAAALTAGLFPMICVGETLAERRAGRVEEVILRQLDAALAGLPAAALPAAIAYEPVWAIGTGETATPEDAAAAHATLRRRLTERLGEARSRDLPILYGGSVKPDNAAELLRAPAVDGLLGGGASLD